MGIPVPGPLAPVKSFAPAITHSCVCESKCTDPLQRVMSHYGYHHLDDAIRPATPRGTHNDMTFEEALRDAADLYIREGVVPDQVSDMCRQKVCGRS